MVKQQKIFLLIPDFQMWMPVITGMENIYLMEIPTELLHGRYLEQTVEDYFLFNQYGLLSSEQKK